MNGRCFFDDGGFLVLVEFEGKRALAANDGGDEAFRRRAA